MTIEITHPEVETLINERLHSGAFRYAQEVILAALRSSALWNATAGVVVRAEGDPRLAAIETLRTFGKTQGLSLGGITLRQLREEARL